MAKNDDSKGEHESRKAGISLSVKAHSDRSPDFDRLGVRKAGTELSVKIHDNGKVDVRGAKVPAVDSSTITATTAFGSTSVPWIINIGTSTKYSGKGGKNINPPAIAVGDVISSSGPLNTGASQLSVDAKSVKVWTFKVQ